jgi:uncharacterized protein YqjF (DUF2071 family)
MDDALRPLALQRWSRLLFLHWRVPAAALSPLLPPGLDVDTCDGSAWVSVVPFTLSGTRPPWGMAVPLLSDSHEVNLRTYVHRDGRDPGVWFFSLDASNPLATPFARLLYKLPYFVARMSLRGDGPSVFRSRRVGSGAHCDVTYEGVGPAAPAAPGTLDHFLVERYLLYAASGPRLFHARVRHAPYALREARFSGFSETLSAAAGIPSGVPERAHAVDGLDVQIFPLRRG